MQLCYGLYAGLLQKGMHVYFIKLFYYLGEPNVKFTSLTRIIFYPNADVLLNYGSRLINSSND